ncbi:MAG TPA: radical SAM protein [Dissulfurispiraceae bacterium]|nr:radical SAM protein [Dissulfurispiraceae bacterium]
MREKKFGHITIPLQRVHIELTNICDFNCTFCPKSMMKRPYGSMDRALAERLIDEIATEGICEKITFHVMGEPMLHRDFFAILDHAQRRCAQVGLTTNGGRLGGATGTRLLDYPLYQLDISLQTPDEKSFGLRKAGKLQFREYLDGIFSFFAAYHKRYPDTIFKFRFLNTRFPKKSMEKKTGPIRVISSTEELRETFRYWAGRVYDALGTSGKERVEALQTIAGLSAFKWHVVEVAPKVFFETYMLEDWGHAFGDEKVHDAWGGYCFGLRDHFAVLWNGDVVLCCIDYDGNTVVGNVGSATLKDVMSSDAVGKIMKGFEKYRLEHPYCKRCLGSSSRIGWALKPILAVSGLKLLKPLFYKKTKLAVR